MTETQGEAISSVDRTMPNSDSDIGAVTAGKSSLAPVAIAAHQTTYELTELNDINLRLDLATEPRTPSRSKLRLTFVLIALNISFLSACLDQTIVTTAIPTISASLHSARGSIWIGGAYLLANAAAGPIWAKLSDIWGRKPILLAAVALFFASSIFCALASNIEMLVAGRALQGAAGGGLIQLTLITLSDLFSLRSRTLAFALTSTIWVLASSIGPVLGGLFSTSLSWRWCFWINVPICFISFIFLLLFLDVHNPKTDLIPGMKAVDWFGSLSILGMTLMVLLGLEFGGVTFPWNSPKVICLLVFGTGMAGTFVYSEKKLAKYPLIPFGLFDNRSNIACLVLCFGHGMVYIAAEYYLPLYFQSALLASPLYSGVLILPLTITESVGSIFAGLVIHRTGRYVELIYIGVITTAIGNGLYLLLSPRTTLPQIIGFQLIAGSGIGLLFETPLIAIHAMTKQENIASATATFGFVRILGSAFSVVVGGIIFQNSMNVRLPALSTLGVPTQVIEKLSNGDAAANVRVISTIVDPVLQLAVKGVFAQSLRNLWIVLLAISTLLVLSTLFIRKQVISSEHVETRTGLKEAPVILDT